MHQIVYQSYAVGQPTTAELKSLLRQSFVNNTRLGITGLLLYGNGCFLQVLEGAPAAVQQMYARIRADSRHTRVVLLADGPIPARIFHNWSMGFRALSEDDFGRLTGYIDPSPARFLAATPPGVDKDMMDLLRSFATDDCLLP
ncbi:BLUF domain-containing protein [Hymenobacter norwichensis]|uniref:BLUF domain-containing protein n=1 Tax=Hymenobacter norwichensis TaxID=223903 RepID=UPI0003B6BB63|nr:BLUF domain-containing protein [Hymenobacter norwichensis]